MAQPADDLSPRALRAMAGAEAMAVRQLETALRLLEQALPDGDSRRRDPMLLGCIVQALALNSASQMAGSRTS